MLTPRIAALICEYHDLVLSPAAPATAPGISSFPNGVVDLRVRLLEAAGFGVVLVPYHALTRKKKVENVKMLEAKVKEALAK